MCRSLWRRFLSLYKLCARDITTLQMLPSGDFLGYLPLTASLLFLLTASLSSMTWLFHPVKLEEGNLFFCGLNSCTVFWRINDAFILMQNRLNKWGMGFGTYWIKPLSYCILYQITHGGLGFASIVKLNYSAS